MNPSIYNRRVLTFSKHDVHIIPEINIFSLESYEMLFSPADLRLAKTCALCISFLVSKAAGLHPIMGIHVEADREPQPKFGVRLVRLVKMSMIERVHRPMTFVGQICCTPMIKLCQSISSWNADGMNRLLCRGRPTLHLR